jgi:hypothetical protein
MQFRGRQIAPGAAGASGCGDRFCRRRAAGTPWTGAGPVYIENDIFLRISQAFNLRVKSFFCLRANRLPAGFGPGANMKNKLIGGQFCRIGNKKVESLFFL